MIPTKSHLIDTIIEQHGFTEKKSTETVETIPKFIKSALVYDKDVLIRGFGKFYAKENVSVKGGTRQPVRI